jgi:hypothetical protein
MNSGSIYFPAYLGLYAELMLSVACNAFLDIHYGSFPREMSFWAIVFGWTLSIGWLQSRSTTPPGTAWQKIVLFFGIFLFLVVFLRLWGMPRAGIYLLAMLQASSNCVTVTRRQLNLGLLASLALVMSAASHYRADWTMLFYLAPYIIAVVFTLVAEQIHISNNDLQQTSLGYPSRQGQGAAIIAATTSILLIGVGLYLVTPQVNWPYLEWRYGQVVPHNSGGDLERQGSSGQKQDGSNADNSDGGQGQSPIPTGTQDLFPGSRWPTPAEMRAAAKNRYLPDWQAAMIESVADLTESTQQTLRPVIAQFIDLWEALKRWLKEHWLASILSLLGLMLLAILLAFAALLKEVPWVTWLLMQWEYLRLGILALHATGERGARQYYKAMARMLTLHDLTRPLTANTREYLAQIGRTRKDLHPLAAEMTLLFEKARYGSGLIDNSYLMKMRELYRETYRNLE